jgi:hypothetical protein
VLVADEGTGSYDAKLTCVLADAGYRVVETPTQAKHRGRAKTDDLGVDARKALTSKHVALIADMATPRGTTFGADRADQGRAPSQKNPPP